MKGITTIKIHKETKERLSRLKEHQRETYEEVIQNLIEDTTELSDETKRELRESRAEIKKGRYNSLPKVKKELGL